MTDTEFSDRTGTRDRGESSPSAPGIGPSVVRAYNDAFLDALAQAARLADRRSSDLLFAFAAVLTSAALLFKFRPLGIQVGDMSSDEFIAVLLLAVGLLLTATVVRALAARTTDTAMKRQTEITDHLLAAEIRITEAVLARQGRLTDEQLRTQREAEDRAQKVRDINR